MEGRFKGWVPGKAFGFIEPDDGTEDVFLHQNEVPSPQLFKAGAQLTFDVDPGERGGRAVRVELRAGAPTERLRGIVTFWKDRGFGFISPERGTAAVFVHATALPVDEGGYLCTGDVVEFAALEGKKGLEASDVSVVDWTPPSDHLAAFADMGPPGWLQSLGGEDGLAEKEPWNYRHTTSPEPLPILRNYVRHTFQRLEEMEGGIGLSHDEQCAAFNTGLVTPNQEEIYAFFRRNPRQGRQPWRLDRFRKASDWEFIERFGSSAPPLANYFEDPSVLLYDRRCQLFISIDHVMEQIARFPKHLQENPFVARQLLTSAEAMTKKRVYRNYKTAVPQYYRDKGGSGAVQLLLPICFEDPSRADIALVVAKTDAGDAYRGSTVLTLDMAYNNARLLARPDNEWLQP